MIDIKLDRQYRIYSKDVYNSFTLQKTTHKKGLKSPVVKEHYYNKLEDALNFYMTDKLSNRPDKISTIKDYLSEYSKLLQEVKKITSQES